MGRKKVLLSGFYVPLALLSFKVLKCTQGTLILDRALQNEGNGNVTNISNN